MKKIYTFVLAALIAASASASTYDVKQFDGRIKTVPATTLKADQTDAALATKSAKVKANADTDAAKAIEGEYTITIGEFYFGEEGRGMVEAPAIITRNGDKITISCEEFLEDVTATYDETSGVITFENGSVFPVRLGQSTYYTQFCPFRWDDTLKIVKGSFTATYADGKIAFPADHGFSWQAFTDEAMTNPVGYLALFDVIEMVSAADIETYEDCDWTENIIYGAFRPEDSSNTNTNTNTTAAKTTVKYNDTKKTYEIVNAFQATFDKLNFESKAPNMIVNAADPANCIVELTSTHINGGLTDGLYYVCSQSSQDGDSTGEDFRITCVENANTITLTFPVKSMLLYASTPQKYYYASAAPCVLVITKSGDASGISGIVSDEDNNAPAEYFNLQGVRVANPEAGQLVICRQGDKVSKILVK